MSLHYILDGYNIIKGNSRLASRELKAARENLVGLIEKHKPQGSLKNLVTVVFDGREDVVGEPGKSHARVAFSCGESADEKIRSIISASSHKKNIIVVTDDKELRFSVRALGAKILDVKDFLLKVKLSLPQPKVLKGYPKKPDDEKIISKTLEYKITSEFEKIWLKEK